MSEKQMKGVRMSAELSKHMISRYPSFPGTPCLAISVN